MVRTVDPVEQHSLLRSHAINDALHNRWGSLDGHKVILLVDRDNMHHGALLGIAVPNDTSLFDVSPSIFRALRAEGYLGKTIWVSKINISNHEDDSSLNCVYLWECTERPGEPLHVADIGMGDLAPGSANDFRQFINENPLNPAFRRI